MCSAPFTLTWLIQIIELLMWEIVKKNMPKYNNENLASKGFWILVNAGHFESIFISRNAFGN